MPPPQIAEQLQSEGGGREKEDEEGRADAMGIKEFVNAVVRLSWAGYQKSVLKGANGQGTLEARAG